MFEKSHLQHVQALHQNYKNVLIEQKLDAILISSGIGALKYSGDDQHWAFVPTPHFLHWLPFAPPGAMLCITKDEAILFQSDSTSFWDSPVVDHFFYDRTFFEHKFYGKIEDIKSQIPANICFIGDCPKLKKEFPVDNAAVIDSLEYIRTRKSPYEISCISEATKMAAKGHSALKNLFLEGKPSEFDLLFAYYSSTKQTPSETAYDPIIAFGKNAATLHHLNYSHKPATEIDESFLLDAGSRFQGYCSDVTRTYVRGDSSEAKEFAKLISSLDVIQQKLCENFIVGKKYEDLHNLCHEWLAGLIAECGMIRASVDELVSSGATRVLLPHGLGHSLGIQVHDIGMRKTLPSKENPYLRNTSTVEDGQVTTIEPGLYFIDSLLKGLEKISERVDWKMIDRLKKFGGIRIEDNVLATVKGPQNLTRPYIP